MVDPNIPVLGFSPAGHYDQQIEQNLNPENEEMGEKEEDMKSGDESENSEDGSQKNQEDDSDPDDEVNNWEKNFIKNSRDSFL